MRRPSILSTLLCAALLCPPGLAQQGRIQLQTDASMRAPLTVKFTADVDSGGTVRWDFGDGSGGQGGGVSHTYYRPGHYTVTAQLPGGVARLAVDVRAGPPEAANLVVLFSPDGVQLSAAGSTVYAPFTPHFLLDGQPVDDASLHPAAGQHTASVQIGGASGPLQQTVTFRSGPLTTDAAYDGQLLALTNDARVRGWDCDHMRYGGTPLPPLRPDTRLDRAALAQSAGMALNGYFAHRSAVDGSTPALRVQASGYRYSSAGENVASGQRTPQEAVDGWLHSPEHCHNVMGAFSDLGVAYVSAPQSEYGSYWTQVFGEPQR